MKVAIATYIVLILSPAGICDFDINDEDYQLLPPIYQIDPYDECLAANKNYCKISIKLEPVDSESPSRIWNVIKATKTSKRHYKHDELYYAICVDDYIGPKANENVTGMEADVLSQFFTNKYANIGIKAKVTQLRCEPHNEDLYKATFFDYLILFVFSSYLTATFIISVYDSKRNFDRGINKFLVVFSLKNSYQKIMRNYRKSCTEKLRCIQGVRVYTTISIIFCHTFCSFATGYVENTKYLEDIPSNIFRHTLRNSFQFLVQTFFLISGWLLSYKSFKMFSQKKRVSSLRFFLLSFINRYLRMFPPLLVVIMSTCSVWIFGRLYTPIKDIFSDPEYLRCRKTWWAALCFINNHFQPYQICYPISWYLSADTQLYVISLIILITIYNNRETKICLILGSALCIGVIIPAIVTYIYNLDIIYRISPENSKSPVTFPFELIAIYASTHSNMASYMLGLIFGYIYFKYDGNEFFKHKIVSYFWWLLFLGLPLVSVLTSGYIFSRFHSAILAGILKPVYALGMAVGILGMLQNIGGYAKAIFEWKPLIFLGNITYCTYLVQFTTIFYRSCLAKRTMYVSDLVLFSSFIQDIFFSFLCGFIMHMVVEIPMSQLQEMLIPKLRYDVSKNKH